MWATLPVFSRFSYAHGSDSITSAAMRAYLACLVFICWFLADGTFKKVKIKDLPFYICYGLFGVGCGGTDPAESAS